jgi:hypothetical protein
VPLGALVRGLVAVVEEGVERGVLGQVGLDIGDPVRDEVLEPAIGEDICDPVGVTLHVTPIGTSADVPNGPFGLPIPGFRLRLPRATF